MIEKARRLIFGAFKMTSRFEQCTANATDRLVFDRSQFIESYSQYLSEYFLLISLFCLYNQK
jgi:hypothetical protein